MNPTPKPRNNPNLAWISVMLIFGGIGVRRVARSAAEFQGPEELTWAFTAGWLLIGAGLVVSLARLFRYLDGRVHDFDAQRSSPPHSAVDDVPMPSHRRDVDEFKDKHSRPEPGKSASAAD